MAFCSQCGRKLADGELCNCPQSVAKRAAANAQQNTGNSGGAANNFQQNLYNTVNSAQTRLNQASGEVDLAGGFVKSVLTMKNNIVDCYEGLIKGKYYERNENVIPDNVDANDSEVVIKQYDNIARLRSIGTLTWAFGKILLTNKRLIFRAPGYSPISGKTILQYEFAIDKLAGFEAKRSPKFSIWDLIGASIVSSIGGSLPIFLLAKIAESSVPLSLIFALLFFVILLAPLLLLMNSNHSYLKLLFVSAVSYSIGTGAFTALAAEHKILFVLYLILYIAALILHITLFIRVIFPAELVLTMNTDGGQKVVEIKRKPWVGLLACVFGAEPAEVYTGFAQVQPYKNTDPAIKELGAIISDIQKFGDFAIDKWKNK